MNKFLETKLREWGIKEPKKFLELLEECGAVIAGSFALCVYQEKADGFKPNDIDIFIDHYSPVKKLVEKLEKEHDIMYHHYSSREYTFICNSKTYKAKENKNKIQIVEYRGAPKQAIMEFDITCCQTWIDNVFGKAFTLHPELTDNGNVRLNIVREGAGEMLDVRIRKYLERGFTFLIDDIARITKPLSCRKINNIVSCLKTYESQRDLVEENEKILKSMMEKCTILTEQELEAIAEKIASLKINKKKKSLSVEGLKRVLDSKDDVVNIYLPEDDTDDDSD